MTRPRKHDRFNALRAACGRKPHGTRARYIAGCKCVQCRAANSRYSCEAQRRHDAGASGEIVESARAREHLMKLAASGIGRRAVSAACDVSATILHEIKCGRKKFIRASTERKILSVDEGAAAPGTLISSAVAWRMLDELLDRGYTKAQLAKWLGYRRPALQIKRGLITAATAARVARMYHMANAGKLRRES